MDLDMDTSIRVNTDATDQDRDELPLEDYASQSPDGTEAGIDGGQPAPPVVSMLVARIAAEVLGRRFKRSLTWRQHYVETLVPLLQMIDFDACVGSLPLADMPPTMRLGLGAVLIVAAYVMTGDDGQ